MADVCEVETNDIFMKGKQRKRVFARSLFCYWAVRELGVTMTELARNLDMSVPGIGYCVQRGEKIVQDNNIHLIE